MSVIKAFNGIVYNSVKVGDMNKVVCPPYDVISPEHEINLKKRSPYNFIHVMLAKADAKHGDDDARYAKAGETYKKWLKDSVLVRDDKPCIYYTKQEYKVTGQRYSRFIRMKRPMPAPKKTALNCGYHLRRPAVRSLSVFLIVRSAWRVFSRGKWPR